jgi:hypothetical protein
LAQFMKVRKYCNAGNIDAHAHVHH